MKRGITVHAEARRDFIEARDYLDHEPPGRGFEFSEAVERSRCSQAARTGLLAPAIVKTPGEVDCRHEPEL